MYDAYTKPYFEKWKNDVIVVMRNHSWTDDAILSIDWYIMKEFYYDNDIPPREAVTEEEKLAV